MRLIPRRIRSRLALGYALSVAATVLIYAGVIYAFARSSHIDRLDARLRDDFERIEHAFEISADGTISWKEVERPGHRDAAAERPWAEVFHPSDGTSIRWPSKPDPEAGPFRTHERSHVIAGDAYRIRLGRSLAPMQAELGDLLVLLALCFVPVVGLAWFAGRLLARRALQPVDIMTERARLMGAERLSERLPVGEGGDELDRLAEVFNQAFERIETAFIRLNRFTSDAAHELRTPLAALRAVGEVGVVGLGDEGEHREVISSMLEDTARLTRLVEELLELSRGDARSAPAVTARVDLVPLARDVCARLAVLAVERRQEIFFEGCDHAPVEADADALRRALMNIVDNAIRHGPADAPIHVSVDADEDAVVIRIRDEGPGIAPEHRARIFDRFYRADPSRASTGTGLGLSLAAQAIRLHRGRLDLEDTDGAGTLFRATLPRSVPAGP